MDQVVDYVLARRRIKANRSVQIGPVVAEIVEALMACNGEAHRNLVIERIAMVRARGLSAIVEPALATEIIAAFESYCEAAPRMRPPARLLYKPFGASSHRWALTAAAKALFAHKRPADLL